MVKICSKCGELKNEDEFYSGLVCKRCRIKQVIAYNRTERGRLVQMRSHRRYNQTDKGRKTWRRAIRRSRQKHPVRAAVRAIFYRAVARGTVKKEEHCTICGFPNPEGHHLDYRKPFEVIWLCRLCHQRWHHLGGIIPEAHPEIYDTWRKPGISQAQKLSETFGLDLTGRK